MSKNCVTHFACDCILEKVKMQEVAIEKIRKAISRLERPNPKLRFKSLFEIETVEIKDVVLREINEALTELD